MHDERSMAFLVPGVSAGSRVQQLRAELIYRQIQAAQEAQARALQKAQEKAYQAWVREVAAQTDWIDRGNDGLFMKLNRAIAEAKEGPLPGRPGYSERHARRVSAATGMPKGAAVDQFHKQLFVGVGIAAGLVAAVAVAVAATERRAS